MTLTWPPDWAAIFGRPAPLIVEIGSGNGDFLVELASRHPDQDFIGVERAHAPLTWSESRIQRQGLSNIRLVQADALMALHCLLTPESVQTFHINFSDPWHKQRHHHRRVIKPTFLQVLASRLVIGGQLFIATDIQDYAGEIGLALSQTTGLKNTYPSPWMTQRDAAYPQTPYERKAQQAGRSCYYFRWQRTAAPILHPSIVQEETPMPNAKIELPISVEQIADAFQAMTFRQEDRIVKLLRVYQQARHPLLLFEVFIEEPLFTQQLMLCLQHEAGKLYLLKMAQVGFPRATRGVHMAIGVLIQWLLSLDQQARIVESKVKEFPTYDFSPMA
jgi:tRNA (guanine-N7-)-methyltransferase